MKEEFNLSRKEKVKARKQILKNIKQIPMKQEQFNLTEKILPNIITLNNEKFLKVSDAKEFIRLLKKKLRYEMVEKDSFISFSDKAYKRDVVKIIDKLAGSDLK